MSKHRGRAIKAWAAAALLAAAAGPARGDNAYRLGDLGVLPGGHASHGSALNDLGEAVGWGTTAMGYTEAFFAPPGREPIGPGTLGGANSLAFALNNSGAATGVSGAFNANGQAVSRAFVSERGAAPRALPALTAGASYAAGHAIDDAGRVAGVSRGGPAGRVAVLWEPDGSIRSLGALTSWAESEALGLNNSGVAVGWSGGGPAIRTAVAFRSGEVEALAGLPAGRASTATAIADAGWVVGHVATADGLTRAFRHDGTAPLDLHDATQFAGWSSYALAVNDAGAVVGRLELAGQPSRAFLWSGSRGMIDLNELLDPADRADWLLTSATGINASGQVVGVGLYRGQSRGFLLTPLGQAGVVPEPSALALLGLGAGLFGLAAARRRRG